MSDQTLAIIDAQQWDKLPNVIEQILTLAKNKGAEQAETAISVASGLSTQVRLGEVETIEFNRDKSVGITVYKNNCKGSVATTDLSPEAIQQAVEKAIKIAEYTEADPCSGLADKEKQATSYPDCDLYHPHELAAEDAIVRAKQCEDIARQADKRIINSDGATCAVHKRFKVYGNTNGFIGHYPTSRHALSLVLVGGTQDKMQREYDYTVSRDFNTLRSIDAVAHKAVENTIARIGSQKIPTQSCPVIFRNDAAGSLFGSFISAISGGNLYRESSFLLNSLGQSIFPEWLSIREAPHLKKAMGSAPFDLEGVATQERYIVEKGILQGYVLSSYSARKLGLETTGNCGGVHNLVFPESSLSFEDLLQKMDTGLLVTSLMGQGVNIVTGDYSRGASGFWVEKGQIQYPVDEITVAGNLKDIYQNMVAMSHDIETRGNVLSGSVLVDNMMIAGS